jgi:hypothetical protein
MNIFSDLFAECQQGVEWRWCECSHFCRRAHGCRAVWGGAAHACGRERRCVSGGVHRRVRCGGGVAMQAHLTCTTTHEPACLGLSTPPLPCTCVHHCAWARESHHSARLECCWPRVLSQLV